MTRISTKKSRKPYHKKAKARLRWKRLVKQHKTFLQRMLFLAIAFICGLLIAYSHWLPGLSVSTPPIKQKVTTAARTPVVATPTQSNPLFATKATWVQNFANQTYNYPDPTYWSVLVGPAQNNNNEAQYYTDNPSNIRVEDGALHLIATGGTQPDGYEYGSARIETQGKQSFLYGRIDITAKVPSGIGTWPAVWLLPANNTYESLSPASDALRYKNGGEIDVLEAVGFQPNVIYGVAHTESDTTDHPDGTGSYNTVTVANNDTQYNTYTLQWTPSTITISVNNTPFFTYSRQPGADYKTWPFDQPFYLIANLALGGTWGGEDTAQYPAGINNKTLPASLDIKSIYYYPYIGPDAKK